MYDFFVLFIMTEIDIVNPFLANVPILYLLKTLENLWFLVISGGRKWEHLSEMS